MTERSSSTGLFPRTARLALRWMLAFAVSGFAFLPAFGADNAKKFDHLTTGWPLTGQHENAKCEDCHVRGIFRGTPKQCATCHTSGGIVTAMLIPGNHIQTPEPCDACHTTNTFYGARFEHSAVAAGTCASCHNNVNAKGKTPGHIATTLSCDACHTTVSFLGAFASIPQGHIPTQQACALCHNNPASFSVVTMNHTGTAGLCTQCHAASTTPDTFTIAGTLTINGAKVQITAGGTPLVVTPVAWTTSNGAQWIAAGVPINHLPTGQAACDQCHTNGTFTTGSAFKGAVMKHAAVAGQACATCHNSPTVFVGTGPGAGGQPFQIPGGTNATSGAANHIPVGPVDCGTAGCHKAVDTVTTDGSGFATLVTPALSAPGHAAVAAVACETCHAAGYTWRLQSMAMVTPLSTHIPPDNSAPAAAACSACHLATSVGTKGFVITSKPLMSPTMHAVPAVAALTCVTCHESADKKPSDLLFQGVTGIYLRPNAGANSGLSNGVDTLHVDSASGGLRGTGDCQACHSTSPPFTTVAKPKNHIPVLASAPCADCHANNGFGPGVSTMKHADVQLTPCSVCHNSNNGGLGWAGTGQGSNGQPWQIPAVSANGGHIPVGSVDCASSGCHATPPSDTMTSTGAGFQITAVPALSPSGHQTVITATSAGCEACHTIGMAWKLAGGATMVTPLGNHIQPDNVSPATVPCASCHVATSFGLKGFVISARPMVSSTQHAIAQVAALACTTCHESADKNPATILFQGVTNQIYLRPNAGANSGLSNAVDTLHVDSANGGLRGTGDCQACHSTSPPFSTVGKPKNHIPILSTAACADCHANNAYGPGASTMKHADVQMTPCAACHNSNNGGLGWAGTGQGTNGQPWQVPAVSANGGHIPFGTLDCATSGCHATPPSDTMTSTGAGFQITAVPALNVNGHNAESSLACEACHAQGMAWKLAGTATMVTASTTHVPPDNSATPSIACKTCHAASLSFALGAWRMPGTGTTGASNPMTVAMHSAVTAAPASIACATCHESADLNAGDLLFQGVTGNIFLRPNKGANSGKSLATDAAHGAGNALNNDCGGCHSTTPPFKGGTLPTNHIPLTTTGQANCAACHNLGYAPGVTTMNHTGGYITQTPCATCHNSTNGTLGWAGTAQGTNGQPWQMSGAAAVAGGTSTTHIPIGSADCSASGCHKVSDTLTSNGLGFQIATAAPQLSTAGHTTVTSLTCVSCHAYNMATSWKGATMVVPAANHIPPDNNGTSIDCVKCHSAGSITAPNGFRLPGFGTAGVASEPMTVTMHAAVSSLTCSTCHEQAGLTAGNLAFQGITTSIILRPGYGANSGQNYTASGATVSTQNDTNHASTTNGEATGDCSQCHNTTPPFANGASFPTGHIAVTTGAVCSTCHTTGVTSTVVLPMPHTSVTGTCASCHNSATKYAGSVFSPSTTGSGGTFGTQTGLNFQARQIIASPPIGSTGGHIPLPTGDDCNVCHTSTSAFGPGTAMVHTGISSGCATCHSANMSWYGVTALATPLKTTANKVLSPLHVPITTSYSAACELCHSATTFTSFLGGKVDHTSGTTQFMVYTRGNGKSGSGSSSPKCVTCHAPSGTKWYGTSLSTATMGSHQGSSSAADCIDCHSATGGSFGGAAAAAATQRRAVRMVQGGPGMLGRPFVHSGVLPGHCADCHSPAGGAIVPPAAHLPTQLSCDTCHRTTSWIPAIYSHSSVAQGACASCHSPGWATPKPAGHMLTMRSCDQCHHSTAAWTPVSWAHFDTVYTPHSAVVPCAACHAGGTEQVVWKYPTLQPGCAGCHGPAFQPGSVKKLMGPRPVPRP